MGDSKNSKQGAHQARDPESRSSVPPIEDWSRLLDGRVAVVTGGGAGIGAAIARLFAQHGAKVEIAEIVAESGGTIADEIRAAGGACRAHAIDVTTASDVERLRAEVLGEHGGIDILVNNVGDYRPLVRFGQSDPDSWRAMYDINLGHVFAVTRAFLAPMIEGGGGSIVNVHSVEGMRGFPGDPVYAAMKAGVAQFTRSLAVGEGRHGIRSNVVAPGSVHTAAWDERKARQPEIFGRVTGLYPLGRLVRPEEVANAAVFLASSLSSGVTGTVLPVDAGLTAGNLPFIDIISG